MGREQEKIGWKYDIVTLIQGGEFPQEHTEAVPQAAQGTCTVPILGALQDLAKEISKQVIWAAESAWGWLGEDHAEVPSKLNYPVTL